MISMEVLRTWLVAWRCNVDEVETFWVPVSVQVAWVELGWVERARDTESYAWDVQLLPAGEAAWETYANECGVLLSVFDEAAK